MCLRLILAVVALSLPLTAQALQKVGWEALPDPAAQAFEDPFVDMNGPDLLDLATVVRLRDRLASGSVGDDARPRIEARLAETEGRLSAAGVNVEALLAVRSQVAESRRIAARAVNPVLDGSDVILKGFLIPAPDVDGSGYAYLVPQLGQCSHTPPPPPNQLVRLRLGTMSAPAELYAPVEVTGTLASEATDRMLFVLDGDVRMESAWTLETQEIETISVLGVLTDD